MQAFDLVVQNLDPVVQPSFLHLSASALPRGFLKTLCFLFGRSGMWPEIFPFLIASPIVVV